MRRQAIGFFVILMITLGYSFLFAADGDVEWTFQGSGGLALSAIGPDGTIYVGDTDGYVYAIDPIQRNQKWSFQVSGEVGNSLAIDSEGTIYVSSDDDRLYALNADGTEKWSFSAGSVVRPPAIGSDGTIYFGSNELIYALNPDGTEKWSHSAQGYQFTFTSIGSNETLYIGTLNYLGNGGVYALSSAGQQTWFFPTGDYVFAPAIGQDGTIYAGSSTRLYAINPDGSQKWAFDALSGVFSPVIGADGTIYITAEEDGVIYALNQDGTEKWNFLAQDVVPVGLTIGQSGTIYAGAENGRFYAINPDGTEKWSYQTSGPISYSSPSIGLDGNVHVSCGGSNSTLYAFEASSGGLADSPWPMFMHDSRRSGSNATTSDDVPPTIVSTTPDDDATDVVVNSDLEVAFSESIDPSTITSTSFLVSDGQSNIAGTLNSSGSSATFTPDSALLYGTTYTCTLTTDIQDLSGNALATNYVWSFTTQSEPDDGGDNGNGDGDDGSEDSPCSDIAGTWTGNWSETSCDGNTYSGSWSGTVSDNCSFSGTDSWDSVQGVIDPATMELTATGMSADGCGSISVTGAFSDSSVSGSYNYSVSGSGTFSGSKGTGNADGDGGSSDDDGDSGGGGGGGCFVDSLTNLY
jgi:outer membrane protein assembly factor BamB